MPGTFTTRRRIDEGSQADYAPEHDDDGLHQVVRSGNFSYDWDDNGNLVARHLMEGGTAVATDTFSHDWRDRLVGVTSGDTTTSLVVDPLGRLVAKVVATPDGDVARIYLHDGDQVVAEYVQEAGGTAWQVERRHHWGRWIDDLAVEEVDTDGDGVLDRSLWPVTDLLGSVQLLTDAGGRIVERIEYATDGTPRFLAEDATPPTATRVAWTGDGLRPTSDTVAAEVLEIGFDEWLDGLSLDAATATLTPDGGEAVELEVGLNADGRGVTLAGADVEDGATYALHLDGLRDRSGNDMWPLDLSFTMADTAVYETLLDAAAPSVLAVIDAADGLYVLFDEPVVAADGAELSEAVTVARSGSEIAGTTERLGAGLLKWTPDDGAPWYPQQRYQITSLEVRDIAPSPSTVTTLPSQFTHLATSPDQTLVAWSAPDHSERIPESRYGLTSLFQGRTWHDELGLYYYRARWYGVNQLGFLERDPVIGGSHAQNIYMFLRLNPFGFSDSSGEKEFKDWGSWLGTFVEHPGKSLEKLFSSGVISMWEYSNSGLEIKPNGNMWYQLRADFESPSALTLIRFGDENVPTGVFRGKNSYILIGHPYVLREDAQPRNNFYQRTRIGIAVVKYYQINHAKTEPFSAELFALRKVVGGLDLLTASSADDSELIAAIAGRYYELLIDRESVDKASAIERFNRRLKKSTGRWIEEIPKNKIILQPAPGVPF